MTFFRCLGSHKIRKVEIKLVFYNFFSLGFFVEYQLRLDVVFLKTLLYDGLLLLLLEYSQAITSST